MTSAAPRVRRQSTRRGCPRSVFVLDRLRDIVSRIFEGYALRGDPRHRDLCRRPPVRLRDVLQTAAAFDDTKEFDSATLPSAIVRETASIAPPAGDVQGSSTVFDPSR